MNTRPPLISVIYLSTTRISKKQCAQACLLEPGCVSFAYKKVASLCLLFDQIHNINLEVDVGTDYYKRDSC